MTNRHAMSKALIKVPAVTTGAFVFAAGLPWLALLYFTTSVSRVALFWDAFMTRPLGATVGDFLDRPVNRAGLELGQPAASAILAVVIIGLVLIRPQRPGRHTSQRVEPA